MSHVDTNDAPQQETHRGIRGRFAARRILRDSCAVMFSLIWLFPVYWMLVTAIKPRDEVIETTPAFVPGRISFDSFRIAVTQSGFLSNLRNSAAVTITAMVLAVGVAFLSCAALTQYRFRGRRAIMLAVLCIQMIPGSALLIPQFVVFNRIGLLDSYTGLVLAYIAMTLPFSIWNLRGFFLNLPEAIFESARVEGANDWQILWRITFPLVAPGIVSTSVVTFINAWNDYLISYTFIKDQSRYTLPVWLASFTTPTGTDFGAQMAASVLFSLPVIVFFMIVQRNITRGITTGAVK